ncbi:hypothetical protein K503DRAFT_866903 [Rhizopogon vinicolor AM-OR11-026]|uniref:IPT/TIG domain-containing protein n=1 Tax=Rhizopogon vinicolor AM-OR11-026 TaxID=1314800 RepID=A0A1B7MXY5_9AGAM|nr:hypothetical protein K503DRAFT_866903 [Rhizopogon vinicolor AM-OR11-026]
MSATTATTMDSRSSSPATPENSDGSHPVAIHHGHDLSAWYQSIRPKKTISEIGVWESDAMLSVMNKPDNERMLQLDDLIDEHAYEDSPCSTAECSPVLPEVVPDCLKQPAIYPAVDTPLSATHTPSPESVYLIPSHIQMHCQPVVPPPAVHPHKRDPSTAPHRVVSPPRESCHNLPILTPNIPESGTKSRVETQVRVTVDLAHASSSSAEPYQYDRVGSWKWLKLPPGTFTKKRTRREGKIDPSPLDMLHLTTTVTCASTPHNRVLSCGSCRTREAKRVARKIAARVRPARSDSEAPEDGSERPKGTKEDTSSIIQFNCPEILDFSMGSVVLPVRITCYCRHHREKVGFHVHFTMTDHTGRVVGSGMTPPIMITDDHKSTTKSSSVFNPLTEAEVDWSQLAQSGELVEKRAPSKRKTANVKGQPKKRAKPYDTTSRSNSVKFVREISVASFGSLPSASQPSTLPNTRSPTPSLSPVTMSSFSLSQIENGTVPVAAAFGGNGPEQPEDTQDTSFLSNPVISPISNTITSPLVSPVSRPYPQLLPPHPTPFLFFNPGSSPPVVSLALPKIHRLIPASGPTHGGIEVTILGENFHPVVQLNCVFGDIPASSTQRWSDNTLVCILPPRAAPGVVAVWFDGFEKTNDPSLPSLFTYTDESDRALMELALQVVGLKMTGKIEDAKNVAMRIVGNAASEDPPTSSNADDTMQVAASSSYREMRPLLFVRSDEREDFETTIIKFLSLIDVSIDHQSIITTSTAFLHTTSSGQTLLHLASFLGFAELTKFLIEHDIDLDARDRNGYTALHFAVLSLSKPCLQLLVAAGADLEIVNALGKIPEDIAPEGFFDGIISRRSTSSDEVESQDDGDGESHWGDVESDEGEIIIVKRRPTRTFRRLAGNRTQDTVEGMHTVVHAEETPELPGREADTKIPPNETDEKQTASFVDIIQRTLAQLQPHGIMPNMPQLPLPHLPEVPAVLWGALPQIPMVFPVIVPMTWPFLGDKREQHQDVDNAAHPAARAAQEWKTTWEKWMALAIATATLRQAPVDEAPPMYTPRETHDEQPEEPVVGTPSVEGSSTLDAEAPIRPASGPDRQSRRVGYDTATASLPVQEVESYGYRPVKDAQKAHRGRDRMLVMFWLPILMISLLWALHHGIRFVLQAFKTTLSLKAGIRA